MMTSRNRTSGLPQITQPFKEIRDAEGVVRPIIGSHPFFFPLFPILVKSSPPQSHFLQKTPFVPFPSTLFFFLPCSFSYFILYPSKRNFLSNKDRAFFFPYTLSIKKEILINYATIVGVNGIDGGSDGFLVVLDSNLQVNVNSGIALGGRFKIKACP